MCASIVSLKYNGIAITSPAEYTDEKYYIADHGIREAVFGGNMRDIKLILENIVYLELLRRGYEVTVGRTGDKKLILYATSAAKSCTFRCAICSPPTKRSTASSARMTASAITFQSTLFLSMSSI